MYSFAQVVENQTAVPMSPDELAEIYDFISSIFIFLGIFFLIPLLASVVYLFFLKHKKNKTVKTWPKVLVILFLIILLLLWFWYIILNFVFQQLSN